MYNLLLNETFKIIYWNDSQKKIEFFCGQNNVFSKNFN
jgi:hypothetical protein